MAVTKKGKREFESGLKKKNISDTAISMFRHYGYENTSIADISRATKMSVGSIYHYFGSKEGIIKSSVKKLGQYTIKKDSLWEEKVADPRAAILTLFLDFSDFFLSFGPELSKHMGTAIQESYLDRNGVFTETEAVKSLREFIVACQEAGTINKKRTAEENTQVLFTTFQGITIIWTRFDCDLKNKLSYYLNIVLDDMTQTQ